MKRKTLLIPAILLLFAEYIPASDPPQTRPMTRYEKAIANITDLNELKTAYDTLKTGYDRRYFLNALPGYFADHKIQNVPYWVNQAVLDGIKSNDPLYIREAVTASGELNVNYSDELMAMYPTVATTYGFHDDMLKSTILIALRRMENAKKKQFLFDLLSRNETPLGCDAFSALLDAIYAEPDTVYSRKLSDYSMSLGAQIAKVAADTSQQKRYWVQKLKTVKEKIDRLQTRVKTGGGK